MPRRENEPTGEAETLVGRIDPREMGQRAYREQADTEQKKKKTVAQQQQQQQQRRGGAAAAAPKTTTRYADILEATQDIADVTYRPRTAETREVFSLLLSLVHAAIGDQPQDMVRSAADAVLETLKNAELKDLDKKKEIDALIGTITHETFAQLVSLAKRITDYADDDGGNDSQRNGDAQLAANGDAIDDEHGVAVVFDDENEEEEDDDDEGDGFEVRDVDDSDDDADADEVDAQEGAPENGDEQIVIGGSSETNPKKRARADAEQEDEDDVAAREIDGLWLQRLVAGAFADDALAAAEKTTRALELLGDDRLGARDVENALMELFDYEAFDVVRKLVKNRDKVSWCTRLAKASEDERVDIEVAMRDKGLNWILKERASVKRARREDGVNDDGAAAAAMEVDVPSATKGNLRTGDLAPPPRKVLDLESMAFEQGARLMSNKRCKLPDGSFKRSKKGYEEIHVPAPTPAPLQQGERRVPIAELPLWAQAAFKGATELNRVQSRLYPVAFNTDPNEQDEPLLLCAPTGAGKTNVAMLTILNELAKHRDERTGQFNLDAFKIVYIAPMKALVQEMVGNFSSRLADYGITVNELTGDRQLTKQQIAETQIIVTTPEKWDVITRKSTDTSYTNLVRLLLIDEVHLLHDERGPVLESIVARTIRRMEQTQEYVRLVALSATLPNYRDVARFLRVNPDKGLFYFDASYRPCPLKQEFIGVTEKKAIKRLQAMNDVCYDKVLEHAGKDQVIVFVHSRKETAKTARFLRDAAVERETIAQFLRADPATREILTTEADEVADPNLKDVLPFGFAIHHAGMTRADRTLVEDLFGDGRIQVLVSTATLAWGVNLPAHVVIIKGTQIYNPEKGRWVELSPQDVLQMLGRAGRPQYDTFGEGIIITNHSELQYYLSMMNQQLPIESQFVAKLADNLNAEIVLGNVRNRDEAVQWLGYTYLYVRMMTTPSLYQVSPD